MLQSMACFATYLTSSRPSKRPRRRILRACPQEVGHFAMARLYVHSTCVTLLTATVLGLLSLGATSCESDKSRPMRQKANRFVPTRIEVHPLSHVRIRDDGSVIVEAAVELIDVDGFAVRGIGALELEFHQGGRFGEVVMMRKSWSCDLDDAAVNAASFDETIRAYIVPLTLELGEVPQAPMLTATLQRPGHEPLRASRSLETLAPSEKLPAAPRSATIPGS